MTPARWQRIEEIYFAAVERPAEERDAYLSHACREDSGLRGEVEALIRRTDSSSLLDQPPWRMLETEEMPAGRQLGPYRILELVASGGMGRVYKAVDTRLGRTVALKVPKSQFSDRFQREARVISSLNHAHICTLYDVGPEYLVMEYVEGAPPAGPLPAEEALRIAAAVAGALDAAHRQGIVHRDLKPANILLTKSGPKLLDFGIARQSSAPAAALTSEGVVAGTLQYMAPEQIQGAEADPRSDIYSFGVVLYQLLTGTLPEGASRPPLSPPALERTVERCLARDPDARWQSAGDLKAELEWIASTLRTDKGAKARRASRMPWMAAAAAVILAALAGAALWWRPAPPPAPVVRFTIDPPPGEKLASYFPLISPDGQKILFTTLSSDGAKPNLWMHRIYTGESASLDLAGTPVAWSLRSDYFAASTAEGLIRIDPALGARTEVTREPVTNFVWGPDGSGLLTLRKQGMFLWSNNQRRPLAPAGFEHVGGAFLPDGNSFLFWKVRATAIETWMAWFDGRPPKLLVPQFARYAAPGYLLYTRASVLVAHRLDARRGELRGEPQTLLAGVGVSQRPDPPVPYFSVSDNGVLVYQREAPPPMLTLSWFSRTGETGGAFGLAGDYSNPALSPDGRRLAVCLNNGGGRRDIWVIDLERGGRTRLTFAAADNADPTWSPDGSEIAYSANRRGHRELYVRSSAGTGEERLLFSSDVEMNPLDWSRDGKYLLYNRTAPRTQRELGLLRMDREPREASPFLTSPFRMDWAAFSPDCRWVLYRSFENERGEIFMQPFPPDGRKWPISGASANEAHWRADSREIYYNSPDGIMALELRVSGSEVRFGQPRALFPVPSMRNFGRNSFAAAGDGKRFMVAAVHRDNPVPMVVVWNWPRLLESASPGR